MTIGAMQVRAGNGQIISQCPQCSSDMKNWKVEELTCIKRPEDCMTVASIVLWRSRLPGELTTAVRIVLQQSICNPCCVRTSSDVVNADHVGTTCN
jgi:hypothetical protein